MQELNETAVRIIWKVTDISIVRKELTLRSSAQSTRTECGNRLFCVLFPVEKIRTLGPFLTPPPRPFLKIRLYCLLFLSNLT